MNTYNMLPRIPTNTCPACGRPWDDHNLSVYPPLCPPRKTH